MSVPPAARAPRNGRDRFGETDGVRSGSSSRRRTKKVTGSSAHNPPSFQPDALPKALPSVRYLVSAAETLLSRRSAAVGKPSSVRFPARTRPPRKPPELSTADERGAGFQVPRKKTTICRQ